MTFIVHGASGAQGAPVLAALRAAGLDATAAVRDTTKVTGPAVSIDAASVDSLVAAYTGAQGVFVHLPLGAPDQQTSYARAIGEAVAQARPGRVVFSTSGYSSDTMGGGEAAPEVLLRALDESGVSTAVIAPRLYLENLLLPVVVAPVHEEGALRYPIRADYPVSWVSHLDIADIAVRLLTDHTVTGTVTAGALPPLLGADLAEGFAQYLGKPVAFESLDPEAFGELIIPQFGADAARPVVDSYHARMNQADEVIDEARSAQTLLGMKPRSVEQWLRDLGI